MSMGDRLKMARSKAGLSLRALAQCVDVSPMAISKYERGLVVPGSAMLVKMADALKVKPDYFFRSNEDNVKFLHLTGEDNLSPPKAKI